MPTPGVVLLLADREDGETRLVEQHLALRGVDTVRVDTAEFPQSVAVTATLGPEGWAGHIDTTGSTIALEALAAVYYRQPQPFGFPEGMSPVERRFATAEARFGFGGLLASLPVHWVPGPPGRVADAEYKPLQLAVAARSDMRAPTSLLTNDPGQARNFASGDGRGVVYKALMHKLVTDAGAARTIYTTPTTATDIDGRVALTMHQFQANLASEKECDVRVVATRSRAQAVEIHSRDPQARQDFRTAYHTLGYQATDVPQPIAQGCRRYLEKLGLSLGVFDFCRTPAGWYFLECGPGAQWAWMEEATGAPLAAMVAEEVCSW
jgi:hypothetical protein